MISVIKENLIKVKVTVHEQERDNRRHVAVPFAPLCETE